MQPPETTQLQLQLKLNHEPALEAISTSLSLIEGHGSSRFHHLSSQPRANPDLSFNTLARPSHNPTTSILTTLTSVTTQAPHLISSRSLLFTTARRQDRIYYFAETPLRGPTTPDLRPHLVTAKTCRRRQWSPQPTFITIRSAIPSCNRAFG